MGNVAGDRCPEDAHWACIRVETVYLTGFVPLAQPLTDYSSVGVTRDWLKSEFQELMVNGSLSYPKSFG